MQEHQSTGKVTKEGDALFGKGVKYLRRGGRPMSIKESGVTATLVGLFEKAYCSKCQRSEIPCCHLPAIPWAFPSCYKHIILPFNSLLNLARTNSYFETN